MNSIPVNVRDIDVSKITFVPGVAKAGRNPSISIKYENRNLQLVVPRLTYAGGVNIRDNENGGTTYSLLGSLKGCDPYAKDRATTTDETALFYNFMLDLEDLLVKAAVENSAKWFGKKRSEEAIRDGFNRLLSVSADRIDGERVPNGKYPPSFKCKLPVYDNRINTSFVDAARNDLYVTPESLTTVFPKGSDGVLVVSGSVYVIAGGGFGVSWRVQRAQVIPRPRVTAADVFQDLSGENQAEEDTEEKPDEAAPQSQTEDSPETPADQPTRPSEPAAPQRKRRTAAQ
jgi:hypothetical protein